MILGEFERFLLQRNPGIDIFTILKFLEVILIGSMSCILTGYGSIGGVSALAHILGESNAIKEVDFPISFSVVKLVCLLIWFYLSLYSVQRLEFGTLVEDRFKPFVNIIGLVIGPLILFGLSCVNAGKMLQRGEIELIEFPKVVFGFALKEKPKVEVKRTIELLDQTGKSFYEVFGGDKVKDSAAEIIELAEKTVLHALDHRASDLLIDPKGTEMFSIRIRVDGVLRSAGELEAVKGGALINSIKSISGMDISEKRRPQDGAFQARLNDGTAHFRVATAGVLGGEKIAIRVLDQSTGLLKLEDVGFTGNNVKRINNIIMQPSGLILICGPTGSGKTTSLYAMLDSMDPYTRNIVTVEDPVEHIMPQTSQIEVNPKADITFSSALRSILRQDPDVICVGEIRDGETAGMAVQAAHTGHLVMSTLHSTSNMATIVRLMDLGVKPLLLASSLSVIISQRLVRKLCDRCKAPANLTEKESENYKSHHLDPKNICQPIGCAHCESTGYYGRIAIIDVTYMDDRLKRQLTSPNLSVAHFKRQGDESGKHNLKKEGMKKVLQGLTTIDEVKRVVSNLG